MEYKIERNISSFSSYDLPYCIVTDKGRVIKRVETLEKAKELKEKLIKENNNG